MGFIENESATFEDLCLRLERDFPGAPAAAFLRRFYEWRRYTLTLQREADGMREALVATRAIVSEGATEGFRWDVGDWAERLYANQARISAALNGSPQEAVLEDK